MGDLDVQKYLFDLQGYLVIDDILGAGEVASLNRLLDERIPHEPVDELPESQFGRGGYPDIGDRRQLLFPVDLLLHLLRDIDELTACTPMTQDWPDGPSAVQQLYLRAKAYVAADGRLASRRQMALEKKLLALCHPFSNDQAAPQAKLCRRIERFIKELFVFVSHPDVPSENNAAERSLRLLVISRKISGGTRSEQGTNSKMTLASLFAAWRAKGLNPLSECRNLLASPQL